MANKPYPTPANLSEQLVNLGWRLATEMRALYNTVKTKVSKTDADAAYLGKTAKAESAKTADVAIKATQDSNGKVIASTYAEKTDLTPLATKQEVTTGLGTKANTSHTHTIANITNLQTTLDGKQAKGNYATTTALTEGLAGKANSSHTHTIADVTGLQNALNDKLATTGKAQTAGTADMANALSSSARVSYSQITETPSIPDVNTLVFRERDRGILAGYEATKPSTNNVSAVSPDTMHTSNNFRVNTGANSTTEAWTKVITMTGGSVTFGSNWSWANGSAPTLKYPGILVCHWDGGANHGIASYIPGVS